MLVYIWTRIIHDRINL